MKSKRRILILTALAAALLAGIIWLALLPREPVYHGKNLSRWLESYVVSGTLTNREEADEALSQAGTRAIPTLLRWLRAYDSPMKIRFLRLAQKQTFFQFHHVPTPFRHQLAFAILVSMGTGASNAVPGLVDICRHGSDPESRLLSVQVLGLLGPYAKSAVPELIRMSAGTNISLKYWAVIALGQIGCEPGLAIPALLTALNDPAQEVRTQAFISLSEMPVQPNLAGSIVPALTKVLHEANPVAVNACLTLGNYGADAKPALPALFEFLKTVPAPDPDSLRAAVEAIRKIDPEVAALQKDELDAVLANLHLP